MNPIDVLQTTLNVNRPVGQFVLAGLSVLAAAAIAIGWGANTSDILIVAGYVLALAVAVTLLTCIANNTLMRAVCAWTVTVSFVLFCGGLLMSAFRIADLPVPACYVRMLFEHPDRCEERLFPPEAVAMEDSALVPALWDTPDRLWLAQVNAVEHAGPIALQYPEQMDPDWSEDLVRELASLGWTIDKWLEAVKGVPRMNEVRYYDTGDADTARALARELQRLRPDRSFYVRDFSKSGLYAADGLLEIWIADE